MDSSDNAHVIERNDDESVDDIREEEEEDHIGKPSPNFSIQEAVPYSHNWFVKGFVDGEPHAKCLLCERESKSGSKKVSNNRKKRPILKVTDGSTRGLYTHMLAHHPKENEKMLVQMKNIEELRTEARKKKLNIKDNQKKLVLNEKNEIGLTSSRPDPEAQRRWDEGVVEFLTETMVSFKSMEKLNILLRALKPSGKLSVSVKSAQTVSRHVSAKAVDVRVKVFSIISHLKDVMKVKTIAGTTDMWRNRNSDSFMSLSCHVVTDKMELKKFFPFVSYFGERKHSGENLLLTMDVFLDILELHGIEIVINADNASNNKVMIRLSDELDAYYCCIHTMQLCVRGIFKSKIVSLEVKDVVVKSHKLAVFVKRSEKNKNDLKNACEAVGIKFIMPKKSNKTRWNSTVVNLCSVLHLMPAFQYLVNTDTNLEWFDKVLNAAEVKLVEALVKMLERFKVTCKIWESDLKPTIQTVIPELWNLKDYLEKTMNDRERYISAFAEEMLELVEDRFPKCGSENLFNSMAHLLDPTYKGIILKEFSDCYSKARREIKKRAAEYDTGEDAGPPLPTNVVDVNENMAIHLTASQRLKRKAVGDNVTRAVRAVSKIEVELLKYEQEETAEDGCDVLIWWASKGDTFPILKEIVRQIYAIPASSATSERAFSIGTNVSYFFIRIY